MLGTEGLNDKEVYIEVAEKMSKLNSRERCLFVDKNKELFKRFFTYKYNKIVKEIQNVLKVKGIHSTMEYIQEFGRVIVFHYEGVKLFIPNDSYHSGLIIYHYNCHSTKINDFLYKKDIEGIINKAT